MQKMKELCSSARWVGRGAVVAFATCNNFDRHSSSYLSISISTSHLLAETTDGWVRESTAGIDLLRDIGY